MRFEGKRSAVLLLALLAASPHSGPARYTADGKLIPPVGYREWVFLGAGLDMSYTPAAPMAGRPMFDNVFVDPAAWRSFEKNGVWPEQTEFVMEARGAESHGSINKHGEYQSEDLMGAEVHVHDSARFKGGWGFFVLSGSSPVALVDMKENCYVCHQSHGAVQTTFTQFYPTAKPIAIRHRNYLDR